MACAVGFLLVFNLALSAQTATLLLDSTTKHQKVTGFGGFVNSPQFAYGHMTQNEIEQLWGANSDMGYNVMRLYIPIGESNWPQALSTAQLAESLDIIIFASPWSMPAAWKTNNSTDGMVIVNNEEQIGYLKEEHYEDYANYLNDFVVYLRNNGVELAGISIQNEPDYKVTYAGCLWTPQQMASFIRDYGHVITCPIIAPESVGISDSYANAFNEDAVFDQLAIFGGHQYGAIQNDYKLLQAKGMEVWQTEFLINWNADQAVGRDFDWSIDAFDFAKAVNTAMLSDINAWVHYASKRYYGMMGDGTNGTQSGVITKRGYILSHFAKYVTGTTRIGSSWQDDAGALDGSSYLSVSGDSVIVKVINPTNEAYTLTVDLPFFTIWGEMIETTSQTNMEKSALTIDTETFRPKVDISASSFTTLIFKRSSERPVSEMIGHPVYYHAIENQEVTNEAFGLDYQLSGQTVVFDVNSPLISGFDNASNGYLQFNDRYTKLVFHIKSISSPMTYTSANTTLYYINANGAVRSHNYGTFSFNQNGSLNWVIDISSAVLSDGCTGIIGLSNGNYSSILTLELGDVYFMLGNEKMYEFEGPYSEGDSYLLDCLEDPAFTSIDFTATTGDLSGINWYEQAANENCLYYVAADAANGHPNVVSGTTCSDLLLSDEGGDFYVPFNFTASAAAYTRTLNGFEMLVLPFDATIPEGVRAYYLQFESEEMRGTTISDELIPANTPVLVWGQGTFLFEGTGEVSTPESLTVNGMKSVYVSIKAPENSYVFNVAGGFTTLQKVSGVSAPDLLPFSAYFDLGSSVTDLVIPVKLDDASSIQDVILDSFENGEDGVYFDLLGRPVFQPRKGVIYIYNGRKVIF
jgi:glucuronoarabinoxylan endo-1,4-beta-xylanase